jgi:hypothetical protein
MLQSVGVCYSPMKLKRGPVWPHRFDFYPENGGLSRMTAEELLQRYQAGERDFRGVRLRGIFLRDTSLHGIDLSCADLRGASLMGVDLSQANLRRANFSGAFLILARLSEADLSQANLSRAFLVRADLQYSCLEQANLAAANLTRANLTGATGLSTALLSDTVLQLPSHQWGCNPVIQKVKQVRNVFLLRLQRRFFQDQPTPLRVPFGISLLPRIEHLQPGAIRSPEAAKRSVKQRFNSKM